MKKVFALRIFLSALATFALTLRVSNSSAAPQDVWFAPPDSIAQRSQDFHKFFDDPNSWATAAEHTRVFVTTINYLTEAPKEEVGRALALLRAKGIKVSVMISALPVDKRICGNGVEGMVWPGEVALAARNLLARNVEVDSFSFDLPLTNGHISRKSGACRFTIRETAQRLAQARSVLHSAYPDAKFVDVEVPTGVPLSEWTATLSEWLTDFKQASGEDFYALTMDVWWEFPWLDVAQNTLRALHGRGIKGGIYLDADEGRGARSEIWIADAERHACAISKLQPAADYVVVANWLLPTLTNVPDTDPLSLSGLLRWYAAGRPCS